MEGWKDGRMDRRMDCDMEQRVPARCAELREGREVGVRSWCHQLDIQSLNTIIGRCVRTRFFTRRLFSNHQLNDVVPPLIPKTRYTSPWCDVHCDELVPTLTKPL